MVAHPRRVCVSPISILIVSMCAFVLSKVQSSVKVGNILMYICSSYVYVYVCVCLFGRSPAAPWMLTMISLPKQQIESDRSRQQKKAMSTIPSRIIFIWCLLRGRKTVVDDDMHLTNNF